ncbi:MAG: hypothetical protein GC150_03400 [Rhizobiales bacterium]|nr:hypothetical protein [Hyphomicrobiales bacterium]
MRHLAVAAGLLAFWVGAPGSGAADGTGATPASSLRASSAASSRPPFTDNPAQQAHIPCTCRYKGADIAVGDTICMRTAKGLVRATCSRVLNNTSWTITREPCDATS